MRKIFSRFGTLRNISYDGFQNPNSQKKTKKNFFLNGAGIVEFDRVSEAWAAWLELHRKYLDGFLYIVKDEEDVKKLIKFDVLKLQLEIDNLFHN